MAADGGKDPAGPKTAPACAWPVGAWGQDLYLVLDVANDAAFEARGTDIITDQHRSLHGLSWRAS
jgi:hypothetical protein